MSDGYIDTNVFIHALTSDAHADECQRFLDRIERGDVRVRLDPLVVHELAYMLPRYAKQMTRDEIGEYLLLILEWPGIEADKSVLHETVVRWQRTPGLAFVDAYLATQSRRQDCMVYTLNVRDLRGQGATVPVPLPRN